uniref:Protein phosphatase 1 regulatory subunit 21 n=1 Tax=Astyanax mexicanus TaxID=7994 RepID=A0A8B9HJ59_ASTMX
VVDEQANSNSLKEELKQREQGLRKAEQEMDSLSFRNQQLAKRVELLQEELLASEAKGKKTKNKVDSPSQSSYQTQSVFDEDLQKKIQENERLHIQFYEADEMHRQQEQQLRDKLEQLEKDAEQHQTVVDNLTSKYMDTIEKLQSDKARLEVRWTDSTRERNCKAATRLRLRHYQQQLRKYQTELSTILHLHRDILHFFVCLVTHKYDDYNSLNVPPHNRRHQLKARDAAGQAVSFVQDLVSALLNFHSYTEQRVHIYPLDSSIESISALNQKFSQYLHENAAYVRPLEDGLLQLHQSITEDTVTVLETVGQLQDFSKSFSTYTSFLQKILPYQLKSLEEECDIPLCTAPLNAKNRELQNDMKTFTAVFEKLQNYINLLALPSESCTLVQNSFSAVFTQLSACLHGLHDTTKELSKHYSQKVTLEQELPTVTQKLRTTNECLLSSLASLTNSTGKIATFFSNNLDFFASSAGYGPRAGAGNLNPQQAESMLSNKKKASTYILTIRRTRPESVPYTEALTNRRILTSSTESREGLMQQVLLTLIPGLIFTSSSLLEKSRETLTDDVKHANQNITRLQDELSTTKRSYEDQLSMMSDHLCSMNETLSKQREEIDTLKLGNKVSYILLYCIPIIYIN